MERHSNSLLNTADSNAMFPMPEHPLPEEIQRLDKDDTVCQYCGVSYLILNEIKQLNKELMQARNEISDLKGFKLSYEELLQKWRNKEFVNSASESLVKEKNAQILTLEQQNGSLQKENACVTELTQRLADSNNKIKVLCSTYGNVFHQLRTLKLQLSSLKSVVVNQKEVSELATNTVFSKVEGDIKKFMDATETQYRNILENKEREFLEKFRQKESEWQRLEVKLREADAQSSREMVKMKTQLMNNSHELTSKAEAMTSLENENGDLKRQIEAMKNGIISLEKSLAAEQERFVDMRNIVDQRSSDNQILDGHLRQLNEELEQCRAELCERETVAKYEKEELAQRFAKQLKALEIQMQSDIDKVQSGEKEMYESKEEKLKQTIRRESDARLLALQENFENERKRVQVKCENLATELASYQNSNDELRKTKDNAERKVMEVESRLRKLEGLLKELHEEKVKEGERATRAEEEISMLHSIIQRQCEERGQITEALNSVKREVVKAKLPPEVLEEVMSQVPELSTSLEKRKSVTFEKDVVTESQSLRTRAWSFDSQKNMQETSNSLAYANNASNNNLPPTEMPTGNGKRPSNGDLSSQMSQTALSGLIEKRRQVMAKRKSLGVTLPPIGFAKPPSLNSAGDDTVISSVTPSPLGLYSRIDSTSTVRSNNSSEPSANANGRRSMFKSPSQPNMRQSMSESQTNPRPPRLPLGRLNGASDIRSKIAAVLSRK